MKKISALFGVLFGLVFVAGGSQIALETVVPAYQSWLAMKSWQSAPAHLFSVKESPNNVEAHYGFSISSAEYSSDRVYVAPFKDNIGSYHHDLYRYLQGLKKKNLPVTIWYDPHDPNQSVIDREMRWGLFALMSVFCLLFIFIGFILIYGVLRSARPINNSYINKPSLNELRKQWKQQRTLDNYQESFIDFCAHQTQQTTKPNTNRPTKPKGNISQPWLNRKEWRNNRIKSGSVNQIIVMWIFAMIWIGVSLPLIVVLRDELYKGNHVVLFALIFPLAGLFLVKKAWQMTRQWFVVGDVEMEMDPFPGSIGGHVGGSLLFKKVRDFNTKYKVKLQCVYNYFSGNGKQRSHKESIEWSESGFAKNEVTGNGLRLKFRFDVPEGLPVSDIDQNGDYYFWRINVSSHKSDNALSCDYIIPVFNTQSQSTTIRHDISSQAKEIRENKAVELQAAMNRGDFSSTALADTLVYEDKGNEQIFYFPMFRNKFLTLFSLIFAISFSFAAYSMFQEVGDLGVLDIGLFIFSLPFALVGLIAGLTTLYLLFNNLTVTLSGRQLQAIRRLFIFPIIKNNIHGGEIKKLEVKSTGRTGKGMNQIKHYKLIVHTNDYKKVTVAEGIDGEILANQLKEFICRRLLIKG